MYNPSYKQAAEQLARSRGCTDKVIVVGFRSASSKYGEYDDSIGLLTPDIYIEYKGNTLPSVDRAGLAVLQPGDYKYVAGLHGLHHLVLEKKADGSWVKPEDGAIYSWLLQNKGVDHAPIEGRILPYWAGRQHGPVLIKRIGETAVKADGWPVAPSWIDIHRGGHNLTSSEGCQTIYPDGWPAFRKLLFAALDRYQAEFTYSLHQL